MNAILTLIAVVVVVIVVEAVRRAFQETGCVGAHCMLGCFRAHDVPFHRMYLGAYSLLPSSGHSGVCRYCQRLGYRQAKLQAMCRRGCSGVQEGMQRHATEGR